MKAASLLVVFAGALLAGCSERAPATKRLLHEPPIDLHYLHDVFIPSYNAGSRAKLTHSIQHLEECLAEFETFMHDVEQGKVAVTQNFKSGRWQSFVEKSDNWIVASYADKLGPVTDFQKHQNRNPAPMIYDLSFSNTGYIERAEMPLESFSFDDAGRLQRWHGENEPYQIGSNHAMEPTATRLAFTFQTTKAFSLRAIRVFGRGGSSCSR